MQSLEDLKFPIGKYRKPELFTYEMHRISVNELAELPSRLMAETAHMTDEQLDTPYRPDGWSVRQVVHHLADSHINSYIRMKLALTENNPVIKPYAEELWAEIVDARSMPVEASLSFIKGLHARWSFMLQRLSETELQKTFFHPEQNKTFTIIENAHFYAFHGRHHLAQITSLKNRMGWQ